MVKAREHPVDVAVIDGYYVAYRAYCSTPNLTNRFGKPTGAIHGFLGSAQKFLRDTQAASLIVAMEGKTNFRDALHPEYKAGRTLPDDFRVQLPHIQEICKLHGWHVLAQDGYEADDVIAGVCRKAKAQGKRTAIFTTDKDIVSLVDDTNFVYKTEKGHGWLLDKEDYQTKWGVPPHLIPEILILTGDAVDNVPGIPGVGAVTAAKWISTYGSVTEVYNHLGDLSPKHRKLLEENRASVEKSRELIQLRPQDIKLDDHIFKNFEPNNGALVLLFRELSMHRTEEKYADLVKADIRISQQAKLL